MVLAAVPFQASGPPCFPLQDLLSSVPAGIFPNFLNCFSFRRWSSEAHIGYISELIFLVSLRLVKEVVGYVFYRGLGSVIICMCGKEGKGENGRWEKGIFSGVNTSTGELT